MSDPATVVVIGAVLAVGSALQSAAGFGFALFTVPLLVVLGVEPFEAIVLVAVAASAQSAVGMTVLRHHIRWPRVIAMVLIASTAVPLGVFVLGLLADHDRTTVRRLFGGIVLAALGLRLLLRFAPRERLPRWALVVSMLTSGFMGGLCGMSGPPAVLWVMAHRWSNPESRVTLWALFGGTAPVQILLLHREFGPPVIDAATLALLLIPVSLIGIVPGMWIGHRMSKARLRTISTVILAAIGLYAALS